MNDGKELLIKIIKSKLSGIYKDPASDENTIKSLAEISQEFDEDIEAIKYLTTKNIDDILENNNLFKNPSLKARILLIQEMVNKDKRYRIKIKKNPALTQAIIDLRRLLKIHVTTELGENIADESDILACEKMLNQIKKREVIDDLEYIEILTREYDEINFEKNMIEVIKFVNEHNLSLFTGSSKKLTRYGLGKLENKELDERMENILNTLEIDFVELPNSVKKDLKQSDAEEVNETYELIKKNKAELYGILHLLEKPSKLLKLYIILYSTPYSVRKVVNSLKDDEGFLAVSTLKKLLNSVPSCLVIKENEVIRPKFEEYLANINHVENLEISKKIIIEKDPLFMISNAKEKIDVTNNAENLGANKKVFTNKCYKTLALDPKILDKNIQLLKKNKVDLEEFFKQDNYNIIKVPRLDKKLNIVIKENKASRKKNDYALLNKLLINKVYNECINKNQAWSEIV